MASLDLLSLLIALLTLGVTVFVYRGRKEAVFQSFLLLGTSLSAWATSLILMKHWQSEIFIPSILFNGFLAFGGFFLLTKTFPNTRDRLLPSAYLYLLPTLFLTALLPFNVIIEGAIFHPDGHIEPKNGDAFVLFAAIAISYMLAGIDLIYQKWRHATGIRKNQITYLALGLFLSFGMITVVDIILPWAGMYQFNVLGSLGPLIFVGFTAYAIIQHRLLDITIIIQRGLIYTALFVIVVGIYIAILHVLGLLFHQITDTTAIASAALASIICTFTAPRIDRYLRKKTDRYFHKDTYNYSDALYSLSETINKNVLLQDIVEHTESALAKLFKTDTVSIRIAAEAADTPENEERKTLAIPITFEGKLIGSIFLGEKLSGDRYTEEDVALLKTFAHQVAMAFEKARLYKEVEDYSRELEQRVMERTAQIQTMQENQTHMMLDISHRLQNPLTIIKGEISFLRRQMRDNSDIAAFEKSIDEISAFIYDLLRFARLESQQEIFRTEPCDVSALLDELTEYYETIARGKGITLENHIEGDICVLGNKEKLQELVTNLVSNAIKYMNGGKKGADRRITITLEKRGAQAALVVADTGMGISAHDLPHIFDRFYRIEDDRRQHISGTGLGLAICKKIVELHHGSIEAQSTPGAGTTMTALLPMVQCATADQPATETRDMFAT